MEINKKFFYTVVLNFPKVKRNGVRLLMSNIKRPIIHIPLSSFEKVVEILAAIGTMSSLVFLLVYWSAIPQAIPIHFDSLGEPNLFGEKSTLIILCVVVLFLTLILTVITRFLHLLNYPFAITETNAINQYKLIRTFLIVLKLEVILIFLYIQIKIILISLNLSKNLGINFLCISLFIFFITTIIYFYQAYRKK
jgi:uncharacterized membrane protein